MAKNEIVNVLTIKTEDSQRTIKGLKKEISDLKKILDNAVIGTEEFDKASKDLVAAQNTLKAALNGNKQTTEALAGSYDALVAEMAELKKEWRATADVAKRNDLGKQIDNINTQLKDLDATIGNNQRKVGAYAEEFGKALEKNNDSVAASANEFKRALAEQDDATISTRTKLESVQKVATGLASGYAAVQGAMTLLNIENENLQKAMVKVQSAMAIAQGVGGLKDLVEGVSRAKVAFGGAVNGCKAFIGGLSGVKKAIIGTGIGALVVAVGLLIANWDKLSAALGLSSKAQEEYNKKLEEQKKLQSDIARTSGNVVAEYRILQREYTKLGSLSEKQEWIEKNATAFGKLGLNINDVNSANKAFIDDAPNVIAALKAIARAEALRDKYKESYIKAEEQKMGLKYEVPKFVNSKADGSLPDGIVNLGLTTDDFTYEWGGGQSGYGTYYPKESAIKVLKAELAKQRAEAEAAIDAEVTIWENKLDEAEAAAAEAAKKTKGLVIPDGKTGDSTGGSGKSGKTDAEIAAEERAKRQKEIDEELRLSKLNEEEKLIDALDKKYIEYMKVYEGNQEKQLEILEWYTDEYTKIVEKGLDEEIAAQQKAAEEKERLTKEEYEKKVAASEQRLDKKLTNIDAGAETQTYLNERQKPKGNGEINAIDNELSKLETLKNITNETLNLKIAAIDAEMALFEQSSERWKELEEQKILVREQANRTLNELDTQLVEQTKAKQRALAGSITSTFTAALSSASSIIGALQEGIDTTTKEGFEKNKKMQIANATIQMLVGITSALAGAFTTKSGPWDIALAAIQAATIATTGGIQIANIKKQTFEGAGSGSSPSVSPSMGISDSLPISYTRNLMTDTETEEMNQAQRVYILESDIEESGKRVEIRENNTDF